MTGKKLLKIAIIAGERSGDILGGGLIYAIKEKYSGEVELIGVGGESMENEGLNSIFDYSDLSIIGYGAILQQLPKLLGHVKQTIRTIINSKPDVLIIIDSPMFTHRVAKAVKKQLPELPVINYVCPTVWAWKPERAVEMTAYVDHVLSILPFEKKLVAELGGPPTTYVGHRLMQDVNLQKVEKTQTKRRQLREKNYQIKPSEKSITNPTVLLLPGSRSAEIKRLIAHFKEAAIELAKNNPDIKFVMPTVDRQAEKLEKEIKNWPVNIELVRGEANKWHAFSTADAALAASGTVLLELAIAGIPCVSIYKLDFLSNQIVSRILTWSAALPNQIAGYPVITEYFNETIRSSALARRIERYLMDSHERRAAENGYDLVRARMNTEFNASDLAADTVLQIIDCNLTNGSA